MRTDRLPIPLPSPIANGNGASVRVSDLIDKYVEIHGGDYSYSIAVEYSLDGEQWHVLVDATGDAVTPTEFPQPAFFVRAVVSSFTSQTTAPTINLVGRNAQTHP